MAGSKTWKPTVAGVIILIAGIAGILHGLADLFRALFALNLFRFIGLGLGGWGSIILGIIILVAGLTTLGRRAWWFALIGSILALTQFWLLGILAIILVALSRKEFA